MQFKDYLATFPSIEHLASLEVLNEKGECIHTIYAVEGKLGSLKLYNALAKKFDNKLNSKAAEQGIIWFSEYVEEAKRHLGKHPNIDLLFKVLTEQLEYQIKLCLK